MTSAALRAPAVSRAPATAKVFKYQLSNVLRSTWAIAYMLFFLVVTDALFRFGGGGSQVVLSLMNVVLILIPLVSLVFGTAYLYNSREFVEMMLAQPVRRTDLFAGLFLGLTVPLVVGFVLGVGLPFLWHGGVASEYLPTLARLLFVGTMLTASFLALAFLIAVQFEDRVQGLGAALLVWAFLAIIYDGLLLLVAATFSAYPLETPMIVLGMLNPVSLARVLLLLTMDVAALLGYTGAAFERFFGTGMGTALSFLALLAWVVLPLWFARRRFVSRDF